MTIEDGILDPAHQDDGGIENAGAAGIPKPDEKKEPDEIKVSEDGNVAEYKGRRYVTQEALHNERTERQKLAGILAELDPVMPEFEEFLKQRSGRQNAKVDRAVTSARGGADSDYSDEELEGFAITRGYTEADGTTPDKARAQRELDIISGISRRQVKREVEPVARGTQTEMARVNRERARDTKFVDGKPVADDKYVNAAFDALEIDHAADPNVAKMVSVIAAGLEYLDMRRNGTLSHNTRRTRSDEPMYVERGSGRVDGDDGELSALDIAAARARGKSPEEWAKLSKQVNPQRGRTALEEI